MTARSGRWHRCSDASLVVAGTGPSLCSLRTRSPRDARCVSPCIVHLPRRAANLVHAPAQHLFMPSMRRVQAGFPRYRPLLLAEIRWRRREFGPNGRLKRVLHASPLRYRIAVVTTRMGKEMMMVCGSAPRCELAWLTLRRLAVGLRGAILVLGRGLTLFVPVHAVQPTLSDACKGKDESKDVAWWNGPPWVGGSVKVSAKATLVHLSHLLHLFPPLFA